jgi:hypothetical protein
MRPARSTPDAACDLHGGLVAGVQYVVLGTGLLRDLPHRGSTWRPVRVVKT